MANVYTIIGLHIGLWVTTHKALFHTGLHACISVMHFQVLPSINSKSILQERLFQHCATVKPFKVNAKMSISALMNSVLITLLLLLHLFDI